MTVDSSPWMEFKAHKQSCRGPRFVSGSFRGFTLVEMLQAILIFSIIAAMIYGVMSTGMKLNHRVDEIRGVFQDARWGFDQLARELENARYYDFSASYPDTVGFLGNPKELRFLTSTEKGLVMVRYFIGRPDYGRVRKTIIGKKVDKISSMVIESTQEAPEFFLMRAEQPLAEFFSSPQTSDTSSKETEVICGFLVENGLHLRYGMVEDEKNPSAIQWQESWKNPFVPYGVEIQLTLKNPEASGDPITLMRQIVLPVGGTGRKNEQ